MSACSTSRRLVNGGGTRNKLISHYLRLEVYMVYVSWFENNCATKVLNPESLQHDTIQTQNYYSH
jgi:hypothetical protein